MMAGIPTKVHPTGYWGQRGQKRAPDSTLDLRSHEAGVASILPLVSDAHASPLRIHIWPDPVLLRKAGRVDSFDHSLAKLAQEMIEVMYAADGVGLAAPQIGRSIRMFVADSREIEEPSPMIFVNPVMEFAGQMLGEEEGCLSIPGIRVTIRRPEFTRIRAQDIEGNPVVLESDGFAARVWQHECDHLDGVLIIDRMSPLDRLSTRKSLKELRQAAELPPDTL